MANPSHTHTVTRLTVENFMRVKSIDIEPDAVGVVELHGANAQGKSSLLRAMWAALGGKAESPDRPVREGEELARSRVQFGEMVVERTWRPDGTSKLEVFNTEGATYKRPQQLLAALVSRVAFDPVEFARMEPARQARILREVAGIDTTAYEQAVDIAFDKRKDQNALVRTLRERLGEEPDAVEPVDVSGLHEELDAVEAAFARYQSSQQSLATAEGDAKHMSDSIADLDQQIIELQKKRSEWTALQEASNAKVKNCKLLLDAAETEHIELRDKDLISEELELAAQQGELVEARRQWESRRGDLSNERAKANAMEEALAEARNTLAQVIREANYPIDGLSVSKDGVMFNELPFAQASSAEQLRVSMAMAIATQPDLKIVHIKEGSLLDTNGMQLVTEMALESGFQVWVEVVDDKGLSGLVIEDGELKQ